MENLPLIDFELGEENKLFVVINNEIKVEVMPLEEHPTEDITMPCYEHPAFRSNKAQLAFVNDMTQGLDAWLGDDGEILDWQKAKNYLPPYMDEEDADYADRLKLSVFDNYMEETISGFAGVLTDFHATENAFKPFVDTWDDIDTNGNNLVSFMTEADQLVMRDGFCGLLVDMDRFDEMSNLPETAISSIITDSDIEAYPLRPYLVIIERGSIINWKTRKKKGKNPTNLVHLVLRQWETVPYEYGEISYPVYRHYMENGTCDTYLLLKNNQDKPFALRIRSTQNTLGYIPFVLYDEAATKPFNAKPIFLELARKNRDYYRLYSEYRDAMRKMNCPVPVRKGLITPGQTDFDEVPALRIGPNTGIDLPENGDFYFAEPTGRALPTTREELDKILVSIQRHGLNFLKGDSDANRTATEVSLESAQTEASLKKLGSEKQTALNTVETIWADYYRKKPTRTNGSPNIIVNQSILDDILNSEDVARYSEMTAKGQLSLHTLWEILRQGRRLPRGHKPEEEEQRIEEEQTKKQERELANTVETQKQLNAIAPKPTGQAFSG